jgi:flagellar biosynthetic protein FliR
LDELAFFAFLMVFLRCSAMFLSAPFFSAQNVPVTVRVLTTVSVSAALTMAIQPNVGPLPSSMWDLIGSALRELVAGLLIGSLVSLAMEAMTIAGNIMDLQTGLGSGRVQNPLNGVQSTLISHLKAMLSITIFLCLDAHHQLILAFVGSYRAFPSFGQIEPNLVHLLSETMMLALQIAAPVMGVSLVVDASLGLLARAVPQMMAMQVGMPAKIGVGLSTVALGLPVTVIGVNTAVGAALNAIHKIFTSS